MGRLSEAEASCRQAIALKPDYAEAHGNLGNALRDLGRLPVITRKGDRFIAHNGETIANNSGQSGWIAQDDEDYVRKARLFAADLNALAKTRSGLRAQVLASPLFDLKRFARHFEEAMTGMWEKYAD